MNSHFSQWFHPSTSEQRPGIWSSVASPRAQSSAPSAPVVWTPKARWSAVVWRGSPSIRPRRRTWTSWDWDDGWDWGRWCTWNEKTVFLMEFYVLYIVIINIYIHIYIYTELIMNHEDIVGCRTYLWCTYWLGRGPNATGLQETVVTKVPDSGGRSFCYFKHFLLLGCWINMDRYEHHLLGDLCELLVGGFKHQFYFS